MGAIGQTRPGEGNKGRSHEPKEMHTSTLSLKGKEKCSINLKHTSAVMKGGTYVIPYAGGQEVTRVRPSQVTAQVELIMRESARQ